MSIFSPEWITRTGHSPRTLKRAIHVMLRILGEGPAEKNARSLGFTIQDTPGQRTAYRKWKEDGETKGIHFPLSFFSPVPLEILDSEEPVGSAWFNKMLMDLPELKIWKYEQT